MPEQQSNIVTTEKILLKLTEILFKDQLITPDEKRKLIRLIQSRRSS